LQNQIKTNNYEVYLLFFTFLMALSLVRSKKNTTLDYYLPQNVSLQQNIPTPKVCFNFELGEMHTDHTQLTLHESSQSI
jgi:hypothetical protein